MNDHESLVKGIKQVDVVISTIGSLQLADQTKIIAAIKDAGNLKVLILEVCSFEFLAMKIYTITSVVI